MAAPCPQRHPVAQRRIAVIDRARQRALHAVAAQRRIVRKAVRRRALGAAADHQAVAARRQRQIGELGRAVDRQVAVGHHHVGAL